MGRPARNVQQRRVGRSPPQCTGPDANGANGAAPSVSTVLYDAAVLVSADRNDRRAWAEHKTRLELGIIPLVPSPVVVQASRSPKQAQLRRFLTGCTVVPLGESEAHEAGWLLGKTRTADVVDAVVVTMAVRRQAIILTSDTDDIKRLVRASGREVGVVAV